MRHGRRTSTHLMFLWPWLLMARVCRRRLWRERRRGQSQEGTWRFYPTTRRYTTSTTTAQRVGQSKAEAVQQGEEESTAKRRQRCDHTKPDVEQPKGKEGWRPSLWHWGSGFGAVEFEESRRRRDAGSSSWRTRFRGRGASLDLREREEFPAATLVASPAEGSVVCATCPVPWDGRARCPVWFEGGGLLVVVGRFAVSSPSVAISRNGVNRVVSIVVEAGSVTMATLKTQVAGRRRKGGLRL